MAFVNELVPEEQKSKFDPKVFFNQTASNRPIEMFRWTIDRERDVFLIRLGGGGREEEIPYLYALSWKGNVIKFDAIQRAEGSGKENNCVIDWSISNVRIPPSLEVRREEVMQLLKEGLDAMGRSFSDRNGVIAVNVHFR